MRCSQRDVRRSPTGFRGASASTSQNLATGAGAAWNARATFPAASTLKLAIAVTVLARTQGPTRPGSTLDGLLRQMLTSPTTRPRTPPEPTSAARRVPAARRSSTRLMRSLGLVDTEMYGGYDPRHRARRPSREARGASVPLTVDPAVLGRREEDDRLRPRAPAPGGLARERRARPARAESSRASRPPRRATCSTSSPRAGDPRQARPRRGRLPGCASSTRRAGSTPRATTPASSSGPAASSS